MPLPILDRNVVRVYDRVFGQRFPDSEIGREEFAREILPESGSLARKYNLALDFGAIVCEKRDPNCESCFASDYCSYYSTSVEDS